MKYLIIAEKKDAAKKIAKALSNSGQYTTRKTGKSSEFYSFSVHHSKDQAIIVFGAGHLFTLQPRTSPKKLPILNFTWRENSKNRTAKECIKTIKHVIERDDFDEYIVATDYDVEGSVIGYNIVKYCCIKNQDDKDRVMKKSRRMIFSMLSPGEIKKSWASRLETLDWPVIKAGYTRHEIDLLFGLNLSMALTNAAKETGYGFHLLSIGRVQGPTLHEVFKRDKEIENHVPRPYWNIDTKVILNGALIPLKYQLERVDDEQTALAIVEKCKDETGIVTNIIVKEKTIKPPPPLNLGRLQREANASHGFSPAKTLRVAEKLYLNALISYPRTESEIIPDDIDIKGILDGLKKINEFSGNASEILSLGKFQPARGKKKDDAHPPILPTGEEPSQVDLSRDEKKLYKLITERFLALFGKAAVVESKKHEIQVGKHLFCLESSRVKADGWLKYHGNKKKLEKNPGIKLSENQSIKLESINATKNFTKPPPHYSDISLLNFMERNNIGTKSTRAAIIEKLKERKYMEKKTLKITTLGKAIINVFRKYLDLIISIKMTRNLETSLEDIMHERTKPQEVMVESRNILIKAINTIEQNKEDIGKILGEVLFRMKKEEQQLGPCPKCKDGNLILIRKKNKKRFVACSNVFNDKCDVILPIIQVGKIIPTGKKCKSCGYPLVKRIVKGKKPWEFCLNWNQCPSRQSKGNITRSKHKKK
ncbi:MAG: DNA topoisomerase I [Promethearchaeota archaeon]